jgi:hypothetical protein
VVVSSGELSAVGGVVAWLVDVDVDVVELLPPCVVGSAVIAVDVELVVDADDVVVSSATLRRGSSSPLSSASAKTVAGLSGGTSLSVGDDVFTIARPPAISSTLTMTTAKPLTIALGRRGPILSAIGPGGGGATCWAGGYWGVSSSTDQPTVGI